ncbi:MAG: hypothetical protein AAGI89_12775 [Pseudomonadota bacterium]
MKTIVLAASMLVASSGAAQAATLGVSGTLRFSEVILLGGLEFTNPSDPMGPRLRPQLSSAALTSVLELVDGASFRSFVEYTVEPTNISPTPDSVADYNTSESFSLSELSKNGQTFTFSRSEAGEGCQDSVVRCGLRVQNDLTMIGPFDETNPLFETLGRGDLDFLRFFGGLYEDVGFTSALEDATGIIAQRTIDTTAGEFSFPVPVNGQLSFGGTGWSVIDNNDPFDPVEFLNAARATGGGTFGLSLPAVFLDPTGFPVAPEDITNGNGRALVQFEIEDFVVTETNPIPLPGAALFYLSVCAAGFAARRRIKRQPAEA